MKVLAFLLRFAIFAPLCLTAWWWLMPHYGWLIGQIAAQAMGLFGERVTDVTVNPDGILNTETTLTFETAAGTRSDAIGAVVTNLAPFIALVLATGGLALIQRFRVLGIGAAILVASHVVYLVWAVALAPSMRENPQVPIVVAQVFITMPFILWIALAYWRHILELITPAQANSEDSE